MRRKNPSSSDFSSINISYEWRQPEVSKTIHLRFVFSDSPSSVGKSQPEITEMKGYPALLMVLIETGRNIVFVFHPF